MGLQALPCLLASRILAWRSAPSPCMHRVAIAMRSRQRVSRFANRTEAFIHFIAQSVIPHGGLSPVMGADKPTGNSVRLLRNCEVHMCRRPELGHTIIRRTKFGSLEFPGFRRGPAYPTLICPAEPRCTGVGAPTL